MGVGGFPPPPLRLSVPILYSELPFGASVSSPPLSTLFLIWAMLLNVNYNHWEFGAFFERDRLCLIKSRRSMWIESNNIGIFSTASCSTVVLCISVMSFCTVRVHTSAVCCDWPHTSHVTDFSRARLCVCMSLLLFQWQNNFSRKERESLKQLLSNETTC